MHPGQLEWQVLMASLKHKIEAHTMAVCSGADANQNDGELAERTSPCDLAQRAYLQGIAVPIAETKQQLVHAPDGVPHVWLLCKCMHPCVYCCITESE